MTITFRHYDPSSDYPRVDDFLIRNHRPGNLDGNWVEPAWEYMHYHPALDSSALEKIGIWEDDGEIVAVAHYESKLGEAFFQFHPACRYLRQEMLAYAEENLYGCSEEHDKKFLRAYANDNDEAFLALLKQRGYERDPGWNRPMAKFAIPDPFPAIQLPAGFHLQSLADEADWAKVHRVLWRGFDHGEVPPITDEDLAGRQKMFDTPSARRDLKIVTVAPNGEFASFCGMFYEPTHRYAYVEPVATDPTYRRMGLGKAAVLEGIRRCGEFGAIAAYVGSDQKFYLAFGFQVFYTSECWLKVWE
ncbi:MAG: GNAT family N-acetyltransferase [Chloroflexota bacterium]